MPTSKVTYLGGLRTSNTHLASNDQYLTDAPVDNHGMGQAFSPTDTVATGLANCMLTIMGIKARELAVDLEGATAEVTKTMASDPRRIARIDVIMELPAGISPKNQKILERAGMSCPVHHSLHPDIEKDIRFNWG